MLNFVARAKWDAWAILRGTPTDEAQQTCAAKAMALGDAEGNAERTIWLAFTAQKSAMLPLW